MRLTMRVAAISLCFLMAAAFARAQEQQSKSSTGKTPDITHLRVDILLTEYDGDKKINSLPYTLYAGASDLSHGMHAQRVYLRMGVRVPIASGPLNSTNTQYEYQNVGTNIDVQAFKIDDGTYNLECNIERTAVSPPDQGTNQQDPRIGGLPILNNFSSQFELSLHNGESGEGLSAADPFSGRVMKANVTIHILK